MNVSQDNHLSRRRFLRSSLGVSTAGVFLQGCQAPVQAETSVDENTVPWLTEVQKPQGKGPELSALLENNGAPPVHKAAAWKEKRVQVRNRWLDYLGVLEPNPNPPQLKVLKEEQLVGVVRQLVEYEGEPGMRVRGYLLKPQVVEEKRPGVVVLHSTVDHTIRQPAGVEGKPEKAFGLHLAQMGYVAFCPECFLWHEKGDRDYYEQTNRFLKRHPRSKGMAKMLFDAARGLDVLEHIEEVDADRLGTIGHSLGAKEALYLAALDERVKVAVSSEGGISAKFSNWDAPWYLGKQIQTFGHDHHELLALTAPRPFLLIGGGEADGAKSWPFIEAALPVYQLYEGVPRLGLLNHGRGHSVPRLAEFRSYQWLMAHL